LLQGEYLDDLSRRGKKKAMRPSTIAEFEEVERLARVLLLRTIETLTDETELPELSDLEAEDEDDAFGATCDIQSLARNILLDAKNWEAAASDLLEACAEAKAETT
jgi:hypothetical protein